MIPFLIVQQLLYYDELFYARREQIELLEKKFFQVS